MSLLKWFGLLLFDLLCLYSFIISSKYYMHHTSEFTHKPEYIQGLMVTFLFVCGATLQLVIKAEEAFSPWVLRWRVSQASKLEKAPIYINHRDASIREVAVRTLKGD